MDVVEGAGGSVVVDDDVVVATGARVDAVVGAAALADGPEPEHAAPNAIDAVTSAMATVLRLLRSP